MELRDLEYFVGVVDTGSLTLAARQRGLSQQALSKSLARLEAELGVTLLERTPKGVMVTRMGEALLSRARTVLAEVGHFRRDVDVALGRSAAQFAVGLSPAAAAGIGRFAVLRLQQKFARLRMRVEPGVEADFVRQLLAGDLDAAITASISHPDPQIMATRVGEERWVVVGRKENRLLQQAKTIADLAGADWIFGKLPDGLDARVDQHFTEAGIDPIQPRIATHSILFGMSALVVSDMLAILPQSMVVASAQLLGRDLAGGQWTTPLILMRRRRASLSPAEAALADILKEEAARLGPLSSDRTDP